MSWIDKKYKNHFKEQKYPEGMKQKGWDSMQSLLDKQMPVASPKGSSVVSNPWYLAGVAAVVLTVIGIPFFIANQPKELSPVHEEPATMEVIPNEQISASPDPRDVEPSDFKNPLTNSVESNVEGDVVDNITQQESLARIESANQKVEIESVSATSNESWEEEEARVLVESEIVEPESNVVEAVYAQDETSVDPVEAVSPVYEESQTMDESTSDIVSAIVVIDNDKETESFEKEDANEVVLVEASTVVEEGESAEIEEDPVVEFAHEEVASQSTEDLVLSEEQVNDAEEIETTNEVENIVKVEDQAEDDAVASQSSSNNRAAHLAFLDAEDQAPLPDLLKFSKERFALSVWGGYLFTGKVLSGGDAKDVEKRNNAESPIYTIPTGVGLDYFVNENWTVGIGLGWAEYGEDVDYTLYNVTSSIDTVAFDGRYDSPSNYPNIISIDSTRVIDTINQGHWNYSLSYRNDDSTANKYSGRNTFRYIEVPLTVGYRFGTGRIKPWVKAGVIVGLPVEATYRYPQFETSSYSESGTKANLSAIQYSGLVQVGADFYVNRAISVRLNALGTYQLNSMLTTEGVRQRYYRVGGSLGVAYNF